LRGDGTGYYAYVASAVIDDVDQEDLSDFKVFKVRAAQERKGV
jgi:hypothetical protein